MPPSSSTYSSNDAAGSEARVGVGTVNGAALEDFDVRPYFDVVGAVLAGTANVIMQLALAPVGCGVIESTVESGQVMKHPFKRARTTFTYLAVAMLGTDDERAAYRHAVNGSHRSVRSDGDSPIEYDAFDPALQLWVAACLYWGTVDLIERLHGPTSTGTGRWRPCRSTNRCGSTCTL